MTVDKHVTTSRKTTKQCVKKLDLSCPDLSLETSMALGSSTSLDDCPLCPT